MATTFEFECIVDPGLDFVGTVEQHSSKHWGFKERMNLPEITEKLKYKLSILGPFLAENERNRIFNKDIHKKSASWKKSSEWQNKNERENPMGLLNLNYAT